jgi:hypothetical protein
VLVKKLLFAAAGWSLALTFEEERKNAINTMPKV